MVSCCVCGTSVKRDVPGKNVTFHRFPRNALRRNAWLKFVNKPNWQPDARSLVCSKHFREECFDRTSLSVVRLRPNAVPTFVVERRMYVRSGYDEERIREVVLESQPTPSPLGLRELLTNSENTPRIPFKRKIEYLITSEKSMNIQHDLIVGQQRDCTSSPVAPTVPTTEDSDMTVTEEVICKQCRSNVVNGVKCVLCQSVFHPSCAELVNNILFLDEFTVNCCETSNSSNGNENVSFCDALSDFVDGDNKVDVRIIKYIINLKDQIINELREKVSILKNQYELLTTGRSHEDVDNQASNSNRRKKKNSNKDYNVITHNQNQSNGDQSKEDINLPRTSASEAHVKKFQVISVIKAQETISSKDIPKSESVKRNQVSILKNRCEMETSFSHENAGKQTINSNHKQENSYKDYNVIAHKHYQNNEDQSKEDINLSSTSASEAPVKKLKSNSESEQEISVNEVQETISSPDIPSSKIVEHKEVNKLKIVGNEDSADEYKDKIVGVTIEEHCYSRLSSDSKYNAV